MDILKKQEIEKSLTGFAEARAGEHRYAYAFGIVWSFLNDKQLREIEQLIRDAYESKGV